MDESDREKILNNINDLTRLTVYTVLLQQCSIRSLLSPMMIDVIDFTTENEETKHRNLFIEICKRGPNAFRILLDICREYFMDAFKFLNSNFGQLQNTSGTPLLTASEPSYKTNEIPSTMPKKIKLEPYTAMVNPKLKIQVIKSQKFQEDPKVSTYSMRSKHRGVLFLVNNIHFNTVEQLPQGTEVDRDNLIHLFRQLHFTIYYYEDLVYTQLKELLCELKQTDDLKRTDCFVFGILTHGNYANGRTYVQFVDDGFVQLEEIIEQFNNTNCTQLINKPKVFLVPCCRGDHPDRGMYLHRARRTEYDSLPMEVEAATNIPIKSDILICYATVPGYATLRDPDEGSWYIQALCKVFAKHAHDTHIEDMLKMVGRKLTDYRAEDNALQTSSVKGLGFHKTLFFNPGMQS